MNKIQLFRLLRKNAKLSEKRHPMFEANQYGKLFGYLVAGILAIEFIALGTFMGWIGAKDDAAELIFFIMPFMLIFDFFGRFAMQQTPLMLVKPYMLMPISKYSAIECFLVSQVLDTSNLFWLVFTLPYTFIVWCGGISTWEAIGMLILLHLMVVVNSQWYLLVRTLVNQSLFWWALPAAFYGLLVGPLFFLPDKMTDQYTDMIGDLLGDYVFSWWSFALFILLFACLFLINRKLQMLFVYDEVSKVETTKLKRVSEFKTLNRFGQIGEYLKLEIKSTMRNKAIRSRFIQGICFITFFSLMIAFGDIYRGSLSRNFLCLYAFVFFGATNLTMVMCPEGNYIDLLLVHEENILKLLSAKYYYYGGILLLPFLLMLPTVITGQISILMILAYMLTALGPIYCMLFQLAIINKNTLPLNEKITGKNQLGNKWQSILSLVSMFVPIIFVFLFEAIFDTTTAYTLLIVIGLAFTLTEPYWMRNIYVRMMRRRYTNLEGFHASR